MRKSIEVIVSYTEGHREVTEGHRVKESRWNSV